MSQDIAIGEHVAQVLGEGGLTGSEEAGNPDADTLVGTGGRLGNGAQQIAVLILDAIGGDIFGKLGVDRMLIRLIDLNDLLDPLRQVAFQDILNLHQLAPTSASSLCAIAKDLFVARFARTRSGQYRTAVCALS